MCIIQQIRDNYIEIQKNIYVYTYLNKCENVSITIENVKSGVLIKFDGKVTRKYSQTTVHYQLFFYRLQTL